MESLSQDELICLGCLGEISFANPEGKCRRCFSDLDNPYFCKECAEKKERFSPHRRAFLFEKSKAAQKLMKELSAFPSSRYVETLGSLILVQLERLKWPLFEAVIVKGKGHMDRPLQKWLTKKNCTNESGKILWVGPHAIEKIEQGKAYYHLIDFE